MNFGILLSEISGTPQTDVWSQVFCEERKEQEEKGKLLYLINITNQTEEETTVLGKQIATAITADYFNSTEKPFISLKKAVGNASETILKTEGISGEIACAALVGEVLYVASVNTAKLFLYRNNKLNSLLKTSEGIRFASGFVREGDLIVIASSGFINQVGLQTLQNSIDHNKPEEIVSGLAPIVLGSPVNADSCCLVLKFIEKEVPALEKPKPIVFPRLKTLLPRFSMLLKNKTQKTAISMAVIFLALLITNVVLNISRREEEQRKAEFNQIFSQASVRFEEGKAIINLNNTQARAYLLDAKNSINQGLINIKNKKSREYKKAIELITQIDLGLTEIGGVYKVSSPDIFYDLSLINDKIKGSELSLYKKSLLILDVQNPSLYKLGLNTKAPETLAGGNELATTRYISLGTKAYFFSPKEGVIELSDSKKTTGVIKFDKDWGSVGGLVTFSGNVYLLDKSRGAIIKYVPVDNGFSDARMYLSKDVTPDFTQSIDFTIDGYVWVLNSDGTIVKFGQGIPINFSALGLDKDFSAPTKIFTSDETKNLYILDKGNNRVVVLNKDGVYQAQYEWKGMSGVSDLAVVEEDKKLFLLSGNKIYYINIK